MTITNRAFRQAMEEAGLGTIQLERNHGYFYVWSDNDEAQEVICGLYENMILVNTFNQLTIEQWIEAIKELLGWDLIPASKIREDVRAAQERVDGVGAKDFGIRIVENSGSYTCNEFTISIPGQGSIDYEVASELKATLFFALNEVKELNRKYAGKKISYN